jgi:hypothetical protein
VRSGIWVMNADGSNQHQVIAPAQDGVSSPDWSPDGAKLVFNESRHETTPEGNVYYYADVFTANADGTGITPFRSDGGSTPRWSPDGTKIGVTCCPVSQGDWNLVWYSTTGNGFMYVTVTSFDVFFDWSPDASLMLGYNNFSPALYTIRPDGTDKTTVNISGFGIGITKYSPDGAKFVFSRNSEIWTANTDGSGVTQLTHEAATAASSLPDWQPIPLSYARPKGASPSEIFLVPAYAQCTGSGNRTHGSPLAFPSCAPPTQTSSQLTVGTPDANGQPAKSIAKVVYAARTGDLAITATISDVRQTDLSDYTGELSLVSDPRITDKSNTPNPGGPGPATVQDTPLPVTISCSPTADTTVGSSCNLSTTINAIYPGAIAAGQRSIWQLGSVKAYDGGADELAATTGDNKLFMDEGLFVP